MTTYRLLRQYRNPPAGTKVYDAEISQDDPQYIPRLVFVTTPGDTIIAAPLCDLVEIEEDENAI